MSDLNKVSLHPEVKKWKAPKGPKPIHHKNKNMIGLGRSITNRRKMENRIEYLPDGEMRFTTDKREPGWEKLRSVTQESSLDEFLNTAELADTDFTADRNRQVKIIKVGNTSLVNQTGLLSEEEMMELRRKHKVFENKLIIPRRPQWRKEQLRQEIERQENLAFLDWRRKLASLSESDDLILTPFERNIEVWRQLWRVVERCDLIVQIVDARNPLFFRSLDLENYVASLSQPDENKEKRNLLLVNKADLLTKELRAKWADYFSSQNINYAFFSAHEANELLERESSEGVSKPERIVIDEDPKIRILNIGELEDLFINESPNVDVEPDRKLQIGLVGYPNVGKSSTINALVGLKKVSVSATPGKTKHFQTIILSENITLCDCPGLVFPNFAYTKGELVCNGVLPIDQLREHIPPVAVVCQRIPKYYLEAFYGIHIPSRRVEDGGEKNYCTPGELLNAYARARGYMTQGFGSADQPRASRYILKDYVNGKLLFVNPPPIKKDEEEWTLPRLEEARELNKANYTLQALPETRKEQIHDSLLAKNLNHDEFDLATDLSKLNFSQHLSSENEQKNTTPINKSKGNHGAFLDSVADDLDREFFLADNVKGMVNKPFHMQNDSSNDKKHNKKNKKSKKKNRVVAY